MGELHARALLFTGPPGVGKTTIVRALADTLVGVRLAGFFTEEMRTRGERCGFRAVTFDGRTSVIADIARSGVARVGRYGVDVGAVDALTEATMVSRSAVDLYIIDEIGKMECHSRRFVEAVRRLLDERRLVVATIGQRGGGFLGEVRARRDVELWTVTRANRDGMPSRAREWVEARLGGAPEPVS